MSVEELPPRFRLNRSTVDRKGRWVEVAGRIERVEPRVFQLLCFLVAERSRTVSKEELLARIWGDRPVSQQALTVSMSQLRKALGDDSTAPRFIETVPGVGYRLTAEFEPVRDQGSASLWPLSSSGGARWLTGVALLVVVLVIVLAPRIADDGPASEVRGIESERWQELQLTSHSLERPMFAAAMSPNGETLAYVDGRGLRVKRIETAEERTLAGFDVSGDLDHISWFPKSDRLAVSVTSSESSTSFSVSTASGAWQPLLDDASHPAVAPDGSRIAVVRGSLRRPEIWLIGAQGETPSILVAASGAGTPIAGSLAWSPDGRWLAFYRASRSRLDEGEIVALEVDRPGAEPRVLLADDKLRSVFSLPRFAWLRSDQFVYTLTEERPREVGMNLWSDRFDPVAGQLEGRPTQLTRWSGSHFHSLETAPVGETLGVLRSQIEEDVWIGELTLDGTGLVDPLRLTLDTRNDYAGPWLADDTLLFHSERRGQYDLYVQEVGSSEPRLLRTDPLDEFLGDITPDRSRVLFLRGDLGLPRAEWNLRLWSAPLAGGVATELGPAPTGGVLCSRTPGALCVAVEPHGRAKRIVRFDPRSDRWSSMEALEITPSVAWAEPALSEDGSVLAFPTGEFSGVELFSLVDSSRRTVTLEGLGFVEEIAWVPGQQAVYASATAGGGGARRSLIVRASLDGSWEPLIELPQRIYGLRASPSGRHLSWTVNSRESNYWLLRRHHD